jgi:hypothetical protein
MAPSAPRPGRQRRGDRPDTGHGTPACTALGAGVSPLSGRVNAAVLSAPSVIRSCCWRDSRAPALRNGTTGETRSESSFELPVMLVAYTQWGDQTQRNWTKRV